MFQVLMTQFNLHPEFSPLCSVVVKRCGAACKLLSVSTLTTWNVRVCVSSKSEAGDEVTSEKRQTGNR